MPASPATLSAFGIAQWKLRHEPDPGDETTATAHVAGLDGAGALRAEFLIRSVGQDREVEALRPERGRVRVARDGTIGASASTALGGLAAALYSDTGQARLLPANSKGESATSDSEPSLAAEGHEEFYGGWFGARVNIDVSGETDSWGRPVRPARRAWWCPNGRNRASHDAYSNNGASCWVNRWSSTQEADCRINLHYGIGPFRSDVCNWYIYQKP